LLLPSPPPWGWSTGFIATPRTTGLRPSHLLWPAFLSLRSPWVGLETVPTVALHRESINFLTPEGSWIKQYCDVGSFKIFALVPAARTSFPPCPGFSSMLWMIVPIRIEERGMQLPICEFMSEYIILSRASSGMPFETSATKPKQWHKQSSRHNNLRGVLATISFQHSL
jgi:hypothetical protein